MNKDILIELLTELALSDLTEGADIADHPCTIAIVAIDQCFEDINFLKRVIEDRELRKSKRARTLMGLKYNPSYCGTPKYLNKVNPIEK